MDSTRRLPLVCWAKWTTLARHCILNVPAGVRCDGQYKAEVVKDTREGTASQIMSEILNFGHGGGELSPDKEQASCLEIVLIFQSETYWDVSEISF